MGIRVTKTLKCDFCSSSTPIVDETKVNHIQNHCLALSISDCGFGEFCRQLEYKSLLHGNTLTIADRFYPSSKTCSGCGSVKETLLLSEREFVCESCGLVIDRDLNAAINLKNYGLKQLRAVSPEVTPVDKEALVYPSVIGINETILDEAGISKCSVMNT